MPSDYLIINARIGLDNKSQDEYNDLLTHLESDMSKWLAHNLNKSRYIERDLLVSIYREAVWEVVLKYDSSIRDFLGYVWKIAWNRVNDIYRREIPYSKSRVSLDSIIDEGYYLGETFDLSFLGVLDEQYYKMPSAEQVYFEQLSTQEFIAHLDENKSIGEFEKAIVRHRIEYGTSYNDLIDACGLGEKYRNKQKLMRSTSKKIGGYTLD